ncbi:MAG: 4-hydroxy-tetrahydrodipicolinate synthase [Gemmatimonadetes bacterium]|nr:4-hydroxy-tetrahydrodipicolinate synthase [Gemmatimonadota bacterium]
MTQFVGCGTALVTPFRTNGELDLTALRSLVEWQIEEGIDFLVACGSTGEAQTLTDEERERVVGTVVEVARGRVPVVAGATSNDTARAVAETKAMCRLGVDGILSAAPYYNKPTQTGLLRHFEAIADATTRPVILYNVPGRSAVNIAPGTILELARHPNVVAVKEASGDLIQMMRILKDRPAGFRVLSGDDALTLPLIACGGDGIISVISNEVPAMMTRLARLAREGNLAEARPLHYRLLPLIDANFLETNPAPAKCALHLMGRIENVLRLPLVPVSETTRRAIAATLEAVRLEVAA